MELITGQQNICNKYGAVFTETPLSLKVGISLNFKDDIYPVNGLRHPSGGDTSGWYIWRGVKLSNDPDFFQPLHAEYLKEWCPEIIKFLALPAGWRFLIAPDYEDVWEDTSLLHVTE